jgi:hypothetical protein
VAGNVKKNDKTLDFFGKKDYYYISVVGIVSTKTRQKGEKIVD